ncbi:MAG: hypothetical protein ACD_7C00082G0011 [uncultured bacterium]|nr:MAG: hypothetical protein ACD_7C00082G0011 [uncultured bacterium]HBR79656.1 hypothetical protein [Candidatus Moranbacteria bacterium]
MNNALLAFYLMFLLGCFIASIFIIYHITRYSINKKSSTTMLILFISVFLILFLINLSAFGALDLDESLKFMPSLNINPSSF